MDIFEGFSFRLVRFNGKLFLSIALTNKYSDSRWLLDRFAVADLPRLKMKHLLYHTGHRWFPVQLLSVTGASIADQKFVDQAQGAADGAYISRGPVPLDNAAGEKFAADFTAATGEKPGQFAEQAYDTAIVILAAIEKVAVVNSAGDLEIDRDKLIEAVRATKTSGASGEISFNEVGDRVVTAGVINRIDQVKNNALERIQ